MAAKHRITIPRLTLSDPVPHPFMRAAMLALGFCLSARRRGHETMPNVKLPPLFLFLCLGLFANAAMAALKRGDAAPDFTIQAARGGKEFNFSLAEALKSGPVVLYFYPKSFTSVCTVEAHEFAENIENFEAAGASVIGVSADTIEVQREFSARECRDKFPIGADPGFAVIKAYDAAFKIPVYGPAFANRISYVISPERKILYAYADSSAEKHIENALAAVMKWHEEHKR
jgi:thioredoxin-dependent peroxiredoxin